MIVHNGWLESKFVHLSVSQSISQSVSQSMMLQMIGKKSKSFWFFECWEDDRVFQFAFEDDSKVGQILGPNEPRNKICTGARWCIWASFDPLWDHFADNDFFSIFFLIFFWKEIKHKITETEQKFDMKRIMQVWGGWGEVQEPQLITQKKYRGSTALASHTIRVQRPQQTAKEGSKCLR